MKHVSPKNTPTHIRTDRNKKRRKINQMKMFRAVYAALGVSKDGFEKFSPAKNFMSCGIC
jgi:hypothetical protein